MILMRILNLILLKKPNNNGAPKLRLNVLFLGHGRWQHSLRTVTIDRPTKVMKIMGQILSWIKTTQMLTLIWNYPSSFLLGICQLFQIDISIYLRG